MATELELLEQKKALLEQRKGLSEQPSPTTVSGLTGGTRAALQGATFNFADEIGAGLAAILAEGVVPGAEDPATGEVSGDFREAFSDIQAVLKDQREVFRERAPVSNTALQIAGGVGTGVGGFKAGATALAQVPSILRTAGAGAITGGIAGAGAADPGQRAQGAGQGAALGALIGPALTGVTQIAVKAGQLATPVFRNLFDTSKKQANRIIQRALERDDIAPQQAIEAMKRLGASSVLADVGENLAGVARGVAARSGPARSIARKFLDKRTLGQRARVLKGISDGTGAIDDYNGYLLGIQNARREAAEPLYNAAFSSQIRPTQALTELLKRPTLNAAMRKAQRLAADEGVTPTSGSLRIFDLAKQEMDDRISIAIRQGKKNAVRRLTKLKKEFVEELDNQVPVYKRARDTFAGGAKLDDAATLGRSLLRRSNNVDDIAPAVRGMSTGELHSFRVGVLRGISDQIEATATPGGTVKRALTPRAKRLVRLAFPDDKSFEKFVRVGEAEIRFAETSNRVLGGSPTARIQEDIADIGSGVVAARAFSGDPVAIGATFLRQMGHKDVSDATLREVSKIIFNPKLSEKQLNRMASIALGDTDLAIQGAATGVAGVVGGQQ